MIDPARLLRRAGLLSMLIAACARIVTTDDPLPGWSLDPLTTVPTLDGLEPAGDMLLSALAILGLGLILAAARRSHERFERSLLVLAALGLVPIVWHGWISSGASIENARIGLGWASVLASGLGAAIACRHRTERVLVLGVCSGLAGPLVLRAAVQVYSEHPMMVETFQASREAIFASHGWSADSAMARAYERRLMQPEASAWFAMSNIYASIMAGCSGIFAGATLALFARRKNAKSHNTHPQTNTPTTDAQARRYRLYQSAGIIAGLCASLAGLVLALPAGGSPPKGAIVAAIGAMGLLALAWFASRLPKTFRSVRAGAVLGVGIVGLTLLAVVVRGLIGERLGELSLLFRWFYLQAAERIWEAHPLLGVGPDGFQNAYLLFKNPLSPEEVARPHSIFFDYFSTLGIFGLGWTAVILVQAARAGHALVAAFSPVTPGTVQEPNELPVEAHGTSLGVLLLGVVVPCAIISFSVEALPFARSISDAFGLVLLDGVTKLLAWTLLWLGLAWAVVSLGDRPWVRAGLAGGALAVLVHSQIELTMSDAGAGAWAMLLLGATAAQSTGITNHQERDQSPAQTNAPRLGQLASLATVIGVFGLAITAAASAIPVRGWQTTLREASRLVSQTTRFEQRYRALTAQPTVIDPALTETPAAFIQDLSRALGEPVTPSEKGVRQALDTLRLASIGAAATVLEQAAHQPATPSRALTHTAIRLRLTQAILLARADENAGLGDAGQAFDKAHDLTSWAIARWPEDVRSWRQLAQIELARAQVASAHANPAAASFALGHSSDSLASTPPRAWFDAMEHATDLDPWSPELAYQLAQGYARASDHIRARFWATKALHNHEQMHLDPLAGLSENQLQRIDEVLKTP